MKEIEISKTKIKKLDINLIIPEEELKEKYAKAKADFIYENGYEYGFWGTKRKPEIHSR